MKLGMMKKACFDLQKACEFGVCKELEEAKKQGHCHHTEKP